MGKWCQLRVFKRANSRNCWGIFNRFPKTSIATCSRNFLPPVQLKLSPLQVSNSSTLDDC